MDDRVGPLDRSASSGHSGWRSFPSGARRSEEHAGTLIGIAAYLLWGLFPIYFHALEPASALEILANRILWSLVVVVAILALRSDWSWIRPFLRDRRQVLQVTAAAVLIAVNWLTYVWAVGQDRVIEASLGYFINPLVTVGLGVLVLREKLSRLQWAAVALGASSVIVIGVAYGAFPFISVTLALSFAGYGFIKKTVHLGPLHSLTAETALLVPASVVIMIVLSANGTLEFGRSAGLTVLLISAGAVTAVPLLLFAASARRIPLTLLGLLQYLTPVMQFILAVAVFHEHMGSDQWIGFVIVWVALVVLSIDAVKRSRTNDVEAATVAKAGAGAQGDATMPP